MKVYLANSGDYSSFSVDAAFSTLELAAQVSGNEPIEMDVLDELPTKVVVYSLYTAIRKKAVHDGSKSHKLPHYHAPDPNPPDCPDTTIVTWEEGDTETRSQVVWPWNHSYDDWEVDDAARKPGSVKQDVGSSWVQTNGTIKAKVEKAHHDAVGKLKAQLAGVADA